VYLIYIDESGTPDIKDSENFVLGAIIIHENKWFEVDKKVKELKEKHFPHQSENIEIHMSEIVHRKRVFSKFQIEERIKIIEDILKLIEDIEMVPVYVVIKKQKLLKSIDMRYWAYSFLFERICYQLKALNKNKEKIDYGLLLFDSISKKKNKEIWEIVSKLLKEGSPYEKNEHLIDGPIFSESHIRSPLQIADCVAYIINHNYKINQNRDEKMREVLKKGFGIIENKINSEKKYARKVFP